MTTTDASDTTEATRASRPVTLFTGQWADLPFEEVARLAGEWGYDGLEIACWGDHLDVRRAATDPEYVADRKAVLERNGLRVWTIANHLTGQAVCDDPIDQRHEDILAPHVWGDGDPEGVRQRAAEELQWTARAAAALGVDTVTGFSGSSIWKTVAGFPPVPASMIDAGYQDFHDRWSPILDVFEEVGVRFALEVHPSEIAYDYWTARRTLDVFADRPAFGFNFDPSHFVWQDLDPAAFLLDFADRVYHVHCKESVKQLDGRNGRLSSHLPWGARGRAVGAGVPRAEPHRVRRADQRRVGGRGHGPARRRTRGARVRAEAGHDRAARGVVRRGVLALALTRRAAAAARARTARHDAPRTPRLG
jgi:sugar phosphate isomerase/epimerase